jgi:hypothetical protein
VVVVSVTLTLVSNSAATVPPPPERIVPPEIHEPIGRPRPVPLPTPTIDRAPVLVRTPFGSVAPETAKRLYDDQDEFVGREQRAVRAGLPDEGSDSPLQRARKRQVRRRFLWCAGAALRSVAKNELRQWINGDHSFASLATGAAASCIVAQFPNAPWPVPLLLGRWLTNVGLPAVAHAANDSQQVVVFRNWLSSFVS